MESGGGKHTLSRTVRRVLLLAGTMAGVLVASVIITQRLSLDERQLALVGAFALFLISAFGSLLLLKKRNGGKPLMRGILIGTGAAVILLMIGFLCDADSMSTMGVLRVTAACLCGCLLGEWASSKRTEIRKDQRFKKFRA